ncbi:predicted protein, partial [Nematostella vectensis]
FLVILVSSLPNAIESREAIRETWAKSLIANDTKLDSCLIFVVGSSKSTHLDIEVEEEAKQYGDIFRSKYLDKPRHEIAKIWKSYYWVAKYEPKYVIKTKDDVYIYLPSVMRWLKQRDPKEQLYAGKLINHARVIRDKKDEFYVSWNEFSETFYPDYCSGEIYVFSGNILEKLIRLSSSIAMFEVEDAYFGLLVHRADITP